jgi:predicted glycoside hydrolase/deacetylase ChbG (UPF0249 family)
MRHLVVNADDFGLSPGVNAGIVEAHRAGIVTTTSLMVRQPAASDAAACARLNDRLGVGLHVDLGEWRFDGADWVPVYQWVDPGDPRAVAEEVDAQLAAFESLIGSTPTHLDSHQHAHRRDPLLSVLRERADRMRVPLRHVTAGIRYEGRFYGQTDEGESLPDRISAAWLVGLLDNVPEGVTELCCHPARSPDVDTTYCRERALELAVLCEPAVRDAIDARGISLCTFTEVFP